MVNSLQEQAVWELVKDGAIIGGRNLVANPEFQGGTTFWTGASAITPATVIDGGVQIVGSGQFYQNLNTTDVVNGTPYMAHVYVDTASGTWKALGATVASGTKASGAYSLTLAAGWNSVRFTAGATHRLNLTSTSEGATDTLICSPVEIRKQVDVTVTGQIRNLDVEFAGGTIDGTLTVTSLITASAGITGASITVSGTASIIGGVNTTSIIVSGYGYSASLAASGFTTYDLTANNDIIANADVQVASSLTVQRNIALTDAALPEITVSQTAGGLMAAFGVGGNGVYLGYDFSGYFDIAQISGASATGYTTVARCTSAGNISIVGSAAFSDGVHMTGLPTASGGLAAGTLFIEAATTNLCVKA